MGRPYAWSVWLTLSLVSCAGLAPCPAQVRPLDEPACAAPGVVTPLLRLPTGCRAPWAGVLYTEAHHVDLRQRATQVDALAVARGKQVAALRGGLEACRAQRDEAQRVCVTGVAHLQGRLAGLAAAAGDDVPPAPRVWAYALAGGGVAAAGSLLSLAGGSKGEAVIFGAAGALAGALVGTGVVWLVGGR